MSWLILFVFGVAIGSFLNVVALRYDGEHFLFDPKIIGGRSRCPDCKKTLRWFELIPLLSFIMQGARCRHCRVRIGFQYPVVELLSGLIFALVPFHFAHSISQPIVFDTIWILAFEILLLLSYVDILIGIIPDELNFALLIPALFEAFFLVQQSGIGNASFFGSYAAIFGLQGNVWINHIWGAMFGALFFGLLVFATRGKGMGMGDVKLMVPLGLLFGWPDILIIALLAFVFGAIFGLAAISSHKKTMKSAVPFAPFLAAAALFVFFFGGATFPWYFRMIGL